MATDNTRVLTVYRDPTLNILLNRLPTFEK